MRASALLLAAAALTGCATLPQQSNVELTVVGPPIAADVTGHSHLYEPLPPGSAGGRASQFWSMLGREDKAAEIDEEYALSACPALDPGASGEGEVLARIVEAARAHRVVIINESHVVTLHRDFSRKVISALRPFGYSVLAAETFSNLPDSTPDPVEMYGHLPYPERRLGYYSMEPVFGAMLREAKALGYRFVAYEQTFDPEHEEPDDWRISIRDREIAQAENLAALTKTLGPDEKLIVHVGYAHAREALEIGNDGWEHAWMAARLKRDHEIDPLTIAQTHCRGNSDKVRLAAESADKPGWFDLYVDHPIATFHNGRPAWRFGEGHQAVPLPRELRPVNGPLIIEAFADGEPFDAVPVDRIWVEPGEDIRLALKPGSYMVRAVRPAPIPIAN